MNLNTYQREAQKTDRVPSRRKSGDAGSDLMVPLLGLAGETGELLSEYKKHLRDGDSHLLFRERVSEELGDLLWYVGNVAAKFDLKLEDIAQANLKKTRDRWGPQDTGSSLSTLSSKKTSGCLDVSKLNSARSSLTGARRFECASTARRLVTT